MIVRTLVVAVTLTAVALILFAVERSRQLDALVAPDLALARAQTTAVTGAVLLQALYLLTCRSLTRPNREIGRWSNPSVYAGIGAVLLLQALYVTAPVHARALRVRADRRARARRLGRSRADHPAGDLGGGALARQAAAARGVNASSGCSTPRGTTSSGQRLRQMSSPVCVPSITERSAP